jgi:hypothetical protein
MIRRSTVIVLVVFIILVFITWYLQRNNTTDSTDETIISTPVVKLFDLSVESLSKVQIEGSGNGRLIMEKDEQGIWSFVEPASLEIDQSKAQTIANNILDLNVLASLEKSPSLNVLGLEKPSYRIILTTNGGEELVTIIGNLTSTSSGYYVSRMGQIPVIISKLPLDVVIDTIENPPIFVTPTPSVTPLNIENQIPPETPIP